MPPGQHREKGMAPLHGLALAQRGHSLVNVIPWVRRHRSDRLPLYVR